MIRQKILSFRVQRTAPRVAQRGMATVLIVLLIGTGLTASVLGAAHYLRSTQAQNIASHAQSQAQMNAWRATEIVRQYLAQLQGSNALDQLAQGSVLNFEGSGFSGLMQAQVAQLQGSGSTRRITVDVTGLTNPSATSGEADGRAGASSTLRVVYGPDAGGGGGICSYEQPARSILNGNVTYSGGGMQFLTSEGTASHFVINGDLTVSNGSEAIVSGCTTGNIALSGGGIKAGANLQSQGSISMRSMSPSTNVGLWAREINIEQQGGSYSAMHAGGFLTNVRNVQGLLVGTAQVGGMKQADGSVNPLPGLGAAIVVEATDGTRFQVDRSQMVWDPGAGQVQFPDAAVQTLAGTGTLQGPLRFDYTGLDGGTLQVSSTTVTGPVWGNNVLFDGWGGNYADVRAYGDLVMKEPKVGTLVGGGNLKVESWNLPSIAQSARVAGSYSNTGGNSGAVPRLQTGQTGLSPGLPGLPRCDVAVRAFDTASLRSQANYVFDFDAQGDPRLTVQNVKIKGEGEGTAGDSAFPSASFNLKTVDYKTLQQVAGKDFLGCSSQNPSNMYTDALQCLRTATPAKGWTLQGVTRFPPGVALFVGDMKLDGQGQADGLVNTFLSTGNITLTNGGSNLELTAPNFVSSPAQLCDGNFYPANLCDKSVTPSRLAVWRDGDGTEHSGLPVGNIALATNGDLSAAGWTLKGHVLVGRQIATSGATVTIEGTLTVGANGVSPTTIQQGGIKVITKNLTQNQGYLPGSNCAPQPGGMKMLWSRYL